MRKIRCDRPNKEVVDHIVRQNILSSIQDTTQVCSINKVHLVSVVVWFVVVVVLLFVLRWQSVVWWPAVAVVAAAVVGLVVDK